MNQLVILWSRLFSPWTGVLEGRTYFPTFVHLSALLPFRRELLQHRTWRAARTPRLACRGAPLPGYCWRSCALLRAVCCAAMWASMTVHMFHLDWFSAPLFYGLRIMAWFGFSGIGSGVLIERTSLAGGTLASFSAGDISTVSCAGGRQTAASSSGRGGVLCRPFVHRRPSIHRKQISYYHGMLRNMRDGVLKSGAYKMFACSAGAGLARHLRRCYRRHRATRHESAAALSNKRACAPCCNAALDRHCWHAYVKTALAT